MAQMETAAGLADRDEWVSRLTEALVSRGVYIFGPLSFGYGCQSETIRPSGSRPPRAMRPPAFLPFRPDTRILPTDLN